MPSCHTSQVTSADPEEKQVTNALHAVMQVFTSPTEILMQPKPALHASTEDTSDSP